MVRMAGHEHGRARHAQGVRRFNRLEEIRQRRRPGGQALAENVRPVFHVVINVNSSAAIARGSQPHARS